MSALPQRAAIFLLAILAAAAPAIARPVPYKMDTTGSTVGFAADFGATPITGTMPVASADLILDFDRVANSHVDVSLNAKGATASFPFAAQAMKADSVLDTAHHPKLHFTSTRVRPSGDGALIDGTLTIRGISRPITLAATIWRQQGTDAGDTRRLTIRLTGSLRRSDYQATGFADMVGDIVRLDIRARVHATP